MNWIDYKIAADHRSYYQLLAELELSQEQVDQQIQDTVYAPMGYHQLLYHSLTLEPSLIHGIGLHTMGTIYPKCFIGSATPEEGEGRNEIGRHVNHSARPNCEMRVRHDKSQNMIFELCSLTSIYPGEELTVDYRLVIDRQRATILVPCSMDFGNAGPVKDEEA